MNRVETFPTAFDITGNITAQSCPEKDVIDRTNAIIRTMGCVGCGICVDTCRETQGMDDVLFQRGRGEDAEIVFNSEDCLACGQCTKTCPLEALREAPETNEVAEILASGKYQTVVQIAPAVRAAFVQKYGIQPEMSDGKVIRSAGDIATGKLYSALRELGFDAIFDTNFTADLTIMEEGSELLGRIANNEIEKLPLITSCCPGWINLAETKYPELLPNLSTCKSPQQMLGALANTYYAEHGRLSPEKAAAWGEDPDKQGIDPEKIKVVSIMPCTAKKGEAKRPEMTDAAKFNGAEAIYQDVDHVLTTRELMQMIDDNGIDYVNLPESKADSLLGEFTGAGNIFGATGGVMEAAVRSAYYLATGSTLENIDLRPLRGTEGVKTAGVMFGDREVKVAVAHGGANVRKFLDQVKQGEVDVDFIEIMMCPGGCVGGGGQPREMTGLQNAGKLGEVLYAQDRNLPKRQSHTNAEVNRLYQDFLGQPGSRRAHELLHTHYNDRSKNRPTN